MSGAGREEVEVPEVALKAALSCGLVDETYRDAVRKELAAAMDPALGEERLVKLGDVAAWLRHIDRLSEIPGARDLMPAKNPLWDASFALARAFGAGAVEGRAA